MPLNPHYDKQLARTEPGGGMGRPDQGTNRVKSKSIPNVPTEHLLRSQSLTHNFLHTQEGISELDQSRRSLMEMGVKNHMVTHELHLRGEALPDCKFCKAPGLYD